MTEIYKDAFIGCDNLSDIYFEGVVPPEHHDFGNPNGEVKPFKYEAGNVFFMFPWVVRKHTKNYGQIMLFRLPFLPPF